MQSLFKIVHSMFKIFFFDIQDLFNASQGPFNIHRRFIQYSLKIYSRFIQDLFKIYSRFIQDLFRIYSRFIQDLFKIY